MITITGSRGFIGTGLRAKFGRLYDEVDSSLGMDCKDIVNRTGTLIHLAASISDTESYKNPAKYIDNNLKNLALLLTRNKFDKVIFPSSVTVYDDNGNLNPKTVYGITKLAGEHLIKAYTDNYWILRITNPYGKHDKKSVFAKLKDCKLNNKTFTIYNDQTAVKDFFPVEHVVDVITKIIDGKILPGIYNVGSGLGVLVYDLLINLCEQYGIDCKFEEPPDGLSIGYVPTENLLTGTIRKIEDEWINYL